MYDSVKNEQMKIYFRFLQKQQDIFYTDAICKPSKEGPCENWCQHYSKNQNCLYLKCKS